MGNKSKKKISIHKTESIGDHVFKKKILTTSEIIFDYEFTKIKNANVTESTIDTKAVQTLIKLGWNEDSEIKQQKTNISEIDDNIKSKGQTTKKGNADIYVLFNNKLKIIIDNKNPNESVEDGIDDAKFYAMCLLKKDYDIRIIMSYNGSQCLLKVYDSSEDKWVPFTINGVELCGFPSKELVNLIYKFRDVIGVVINKPQHSDTFSAVIKQLKEIYRNVPHIQNDNQNTMDFTIAFISLKSILEKHGEELSKNWSDFDVNEQKKLKELINTYVDDIINNLDTPYREIFDIGEDESGKIKSFNFLSLINLFSNDVEPDESPYLIKIFQQLDKLPNLHSSKFDPFAEVYSWLMDKHTRKIFGQFFTPRHLIRPLVRLFYEHEIESMTEKVVNGKIINPKSICDPACGTGGFLTESFKYISTHVDDVDILDLAKQSIYGFDIYRANTTRSRINMYLAGDGFSKIDQCDFLKYDEMKFDYIITNPPFGSGDYLVDSDISSVKNKETNFLIKVVKMLNVNGKAMIIVPDGILEAPTYHNIREWLLKNCVIEKIISFPKHEFAPYTLEKTFALFLKKRSKQITDLNTIKTERIWMYIVDTDGYANSDKRFRTDRCDLDGKWLHDELSLWCNKKGLYNVSLLEESWKKKIQCNKEKYVDEWGTEIIGTKYGYVEIKKILEQKYTIFETVTKPKICRLLKNNDIVLKTTDLVDHLDDFTSILSDKNIFYDKHEKKFYDRNKPMIIQFLNLDPITYFRVKKQRTENFVDFSNDNRKLFNTINNDLKIIQNMVTEYLI